jgi:hypothetical protein
MLSDMKKALLIFAFVSRPEVGKINLSPGWQLRWKVCRTHRLRSSSEKPRSRRISVGTGLRAGNSELSMISSRTSRLADRRNCGPGFRVGYGAGIGAAEDGRRYSQVALQRELRRSGCPRPRTSGRLTNGHRTRPYRAIIGGKEFDEALGGVPVRGEERRQLQGARNDP